MSVKKNLSYIWADQKNKGFKKRSKEKWNEMKSTNDYMHINNKSKIKCVIILITLWEFFNITSKKTFNIIIGIKWKQPSVFYKRKVDVNNLKDIISHVVKEQSATSDQWRISYRGTNIHH